MESNGVFSFGLHFKYQKVQFSLTLPQDWELAGKVKGPDIVFLFQMFANGRRSMPGNAFADMDIGVTNILCTLN